MDRLHVATLNILNLADRWPSGCRLISPTWRRCSRTCWVSRRSSTSSSRTGSSGRPVRAATASTGRGPADRSTATACSSREPLVATRASERLDLGLAGRRMRAVDRAAGRRDACSMVVTHLHHLGPDEAARDEQARQLLDWLDGAPATDARRSSSVTSTPTRPSRRSRGCSRRATGRRTPTANGADPDGDLAVAGCRRRRWTPTAIPDCLDYIWVRGAVRVDVVPARVRSPGSGGSDAVPERPPRACRPSSRSGREPVPGRTLRLAHRGDWRAAPENTIAAMRPRWPSPACDGLEFDVRPSSDGVPVRHPRRDPEPCPGSGRDRRRD